jgi:class 3 adenylate cyclase
MSPDTQRERKVITVLFCDLVGFTARAESLDPEDVEAVLRPYHERVRSELERHGGTVEKFAGDAVLALFGAPRAHEDDPERAVRAALAIRDWAREEGSLEVRIGMTTGEALVTVGARPDAGEAMASGDVVNTAARLQTAAPENGVLVDEATYRATERQVVYEEAPAVAAKGKTSPVGVYEAVTARSRFGVDVDEAPRSTLVGRNRELDLVIGALARVRDSRSPQLVTIVGVPGIGKSRLVLELLRVVDADPELITWRQGRCLPYGDGVAFWAVGEMVKAQADILDTDSAEDAVAKLERTIGDLVGDDTDWVLAHVKPLIGLAEQQQVDESRVEAFAAWRRFFEAFAELRPLVLVFEDLHWADDGLLDFADHLVDWASGVPILVVATTRPELLERRPAWGGGKLNAATLALSPLSDTEAAWLVAELLGTAVLPAETQAALIVRAGGNPLYAEQYARLFLERGSERDLPLPETVQGIIAARLDSLPPEEKAALQHAAVVGKVFWPAAITALGSDGSLPELLHSLERKEFVRRERRSTVAGETEYAFRHALVRDVAYGQIPRMRRAESHRLTAEWIDALSERSDDFAELLAHHYSSALELVQASGGDTDDLAERARLSLRQAGNRALALGAFPAAARFFSRALELWPPDDPELPALQLAFAEAARWLDEYPVDLIVEARDGLLAQGDLAGAAEAETMLGFAFRTSGKYDLGWMHWDAGIALLAKAEPSRATAQGYAQIAIPAMLAGDDEEAISG